jgi:hypothetical protein
VTGLVTSAGLHRVCFQLLHSFTQILARVIFGASHLQDISLDHIISHHITSRLYVLMISILIYRRIQLPSWLCRLLIQVAKNQASIVRLYVHFNQFKIV